MTWYPPAQPIDIPAASGQLITGRGLLKGFSFKETTGTASAHVRLRDSTGDAVPLLATITLAPNESIRDWFGESGILWTRGIYFVLVSGAVTGVVWCVAEEWTPDGYDLVEGPV